MADESSYRQHLPALAQIDISATEEKDRVYGASWKKRGGTGAFMMLARKWDRLENIVRTVGWDIFRAIVEDDSEDETVLDQVRDLRRYLALVEAEMVERGYVVLPQSAGSPRADVEDVYAAAALGWGISRTEAKDRMIEIGYGMFPESSKPGTPEDGGHHARQPEVEVTQTRQPISATWKEWNDIRSLRIEWGSLKGGVWGDIYCVEANADGRYIMDADAQSEYGR